MDDSRESFRALVDPALDRRDLAEAALLVGRVVHPDLDLDAGRTALDALAAQAEGDDAASLSRALFGSGRLRGNDTKYYDPENSVIPSVLASGLGIPITLSVIFIEVGSRRGIEIDGVNMPGHFLTSSGGQFFDPFHGGSALDAAGCERLYQRLVGRPVPLPDGALDPTPPHAIVARMLWNLRSIAEGRSDAAMLHRTLGLLSALVDAPLQVHLAWAQSLAALGRYDLAASAADEALGVAPPSARQRIQAMADRWAARLN